MRLPTNEQVNKGGEVLNHLVGEHRAKCLPEVERPQARRTRPRVLTEGTKRLLDLLGTDLRNESWVAPTQASHIWRRRRRVFGNHFVPSFPHPQQTGAAEGLASLGVGPFPAERVAPALTKAQLDLGRQNLSSPSRVTGNILPKRATVAIQPALEAASGEGQALVLVLFARPRRSAQHALTNHLKFRQRRHVVGERRGGEGAGQTLRPQPPELLGNVLQDRHMPSVSLLKAGKRRPQPGHPPRLDRRPRAGPRRQQGGELQEQRLERGRLARKASDRSHCTYC